MQMRGLSSLRNLIAGETRARHNTGMGHTAPDLWSLLAFAAGGALLLAGTCADLYLAFLFQRRAAGLYLQARSVLEGRPFGAFHVQLALFVTLLFALPAVFQKPDVPAPSEAALVLGPVVYALAGLLVVSLCLFRSGASARDAFGSPGCGAWRAAGYGLLYGLAAIPPVLLLSHASASAAEALGYAPKVQQVFDWLSDDSVSAGTRLFLIAAAVLLAPLTEEALFRGILFPALLRGRAFASSALLTGLYFGLVHLHATSLLPLLALSVALSAAYAATGSLVTPVVMHALFNGTSLLLYYAMSADA